MRKITPELTDDILQYTTPETVAKDDAIVVQTYKELRRHIAQLSYANKDCILFYRGQTEDYKNAKSGKSTFYPSIYRGDNLKKEELKYRWKKLNKASDILIQKIKSRYPNKTYVIKRKRIVQWSILQHYEVTETPLIDVTQSLKVACSFATLVNKTDVNYKDTDDYRYVYVFALPYYTNRISVNSEHYLTNVRLLSVSPPQALRPYYQEGFLIGEDEFNETYTNKEELDLNNRLVAKFKFRDNNDFWGNAGRALSEEELYPHEDEIGLLCKEVSSELFIELAKDLNSEITGGDYMAFMRKWINIEKVLFEYSHRSDPRKQLTSASLIKKITDQDLRSKLDRARSQRNILAHSPNKKLSASDLMKPEDMDGLYEQLIQYYKNCKERNL